LYAVAWRLVILIDDYFSWGRTRKSNLGTHYKFLGNEEAQSVNDEATNKVTCIFCVPSHPSTCAWYDA